MTSASPFLTAQGQAPFSLINKPSHPFLESGTSWDVVDNLFFLFVFSFLFYFFYFFKFFFFSPARHSQTRHSSVFH